MSFELKTVQQCEPQKEENKNNIKNKQKNQRDCKTLQHTNYDCTAYSNVQHVNGKKMSKIARKIF